jgi:hypothetical protein
VRDQLRQQHRKLALIELFAVRTGVFPGVLVDELPHFGVGRDVTPTPLADAKKQGLRSPSPTRRALA